MENIFRQIRFAIRLLSSRPTFTCIAVCTLALSIGASAAVFTAVNGILLRPLPFGHSKDLVTVASTNKDATGKISDYGTNIQNYLDWTDRNHVFQSLAAMEQIQVGLTGLGEPEQIDAGRITANFFSTLEVQPLLGRVFLPEEQTASSNVVILSYGLWQRMFGGRPDVLNSMIHLDGVPYQIVGILPSSFYFVAPCQVWLPMNLGVDRTAVGTSANLAVAGRLKPKMNLKLASDEMNRIASQLSKEYPSSNAGWGAKVYPMGEQYIQDVRPALLILMTAVSFLVFIGCANVATLILARSVEREPELALRMALGADRKSLLGQFLSENLVLTFCGGFLGLLLSFWFLKPILALSPLSVSAFTSVSALENISIDLRVVLFTFSISLVTGIFFGILPVFKQWSKDPGVTLKENGRRNSSGVSHRRALNFLVITEISLAFVLLIGATLAIRGFLNLEKVRTGFQTKNILIAKITLPASRYDHELRAAFVDRLRENIALIPGVSSVATTNRLPLNEFSMTTVFEVEGKPLSEPGQGLIANFRRISPDYFRTIGTPLLEGRDFDLFEKDGIPAAIVSREMARRYWPGKSAIGKRIKRFSRADAVWRTVVGVVDDIKDTRLTEAPGATLYVPYAQTSVAWIQLAIRSSIASASLTDSIRRSVWALDKNLPVYGITTMETIYSESLLRPRFLSFLLTAFAGLGFLIAILGVYGVISYSISQRVQEIGIRMALGAQRTSVIWLILRQSFLPVISGIAIGLFFFYLFARFGSDLIPGISAPDYRIAWIVPAGLILASALAVLLPARKATRVDPVHALRCE